jgi:hypothetical protein
MSACGAWAMFVSIVFYFVPTEALENSGQALTAKQAVEHSRAAAKRPLLASISLPRFN